MSIQVSLATEFKVINAAAAANTIFVGSNENNELLFLYSAPVTACSITETSSTTPALDSIVPLNRLVFNRAQIDAGTVTLDTTNNTFTSTEPLLVGYNSSAYHDGIKSLLAGVLLLRGRHNPKEFS